MARCTSLFIKIGGRSTVQSSMLGSQLWIDKLHDQNNEVSKMMKSVLLFSNTEKSTFPGKGLHHRNRQLPNRLVRSRSACLNQEFHNARFPYVKDQVAFEPKATTEYMRYLKEGQRSQNIMYLRRAG